MSRISQWLGVLMVILAMACGQGMGAADRCDYPQASAAELRWFREARFGMWLCLTQASLTGKEMSWCRAAERG